MNTHAKNQGFSTVIFIIIIALVLGLLGFLGWRAWEAANKEPVATTTESSETPDAGVDASETLQRVSAVSDSYTVALPAGWVYRVCEGSDVLFLAPTDETLAICNSDYFGAIYVSRSIGDTRDQDDLAGDSSVSNLDVNPVTIDGEEGTVTTYTYTMGEESPTSGSSAEYVFYQVFYKGSTYTLGTTNNTGSTSYASELAAIAEGFRFTE